MKKIVVIILIGLLVSGCAELINYRKENELKINNYMQKPNNDIMIVVDSIQKDALFPVAKIQCHQTMTILGDTGSQNNSFETLTTYVVILPMGEVLDKMRNNYNVLSNSDKQKFISQLPLLTTIISMVCQCQQPFGIEGKVYFNGKVVASDYANVDYGMVSLTFNLPIEEFVNK